MEEKIQRLKDEYGARVRRYAPPGVAHGPAFAQIWCPRGFWGVRLALDYECESTRGRLWESAVRLMDEQGWPLLDDIVGVQV